MKKQKNLGNQRGITLVALIITIIVLVILAAVAINVALNTGIINFATKGVKDYAEAGVEENRVMNKAIDVMESTTKKIEGILGGKGGDSTPESPTELTSGQTIEKHIDIGETFTITLKDVAEDTEINFTNSSETVASLDEETKTIKGLAIGITEITATWGEGNTATINVHVYDPDAIGKPLRTEDYGKIVVDYEDTEKNENAGQYRLFYQDKNYTYIISDNLIELDETLGTLCTNGGYLTGADVSEIGQRLNPMLKDSEVNGEGYTFFSSDNKYDNILDVACLTDTIKWNTYTNGEEDIFAIGGPTLELFAASYNTMKTSEDNGKTGNIILRVLEYGYQYTGSYWLTANQREGLYSSSSSFINWCWLSSPFYNDYVVVAALNLSGRISDDSDGSRNSFRPLVCIPTSTFNTKYGNNLKWSSELN